MIDLQGHLTTSRGRSMGTAVNKTSEFVHDSLLLSDSGKASPGKFTLPETVWKKTPHKNSARRHTLKKKVLKNLILAR